MEEDINILENGLKATKKNRRGNQEIRFEVNSNYYKALENLIARYKEQKEALQMAKQIMHRDISEDFDYMTLNEFKQYLLKEAEAELLED